ncbi:MAG: pyridoxal phosphate-dependent aminotransferase [Gammaproteobacteria bacterium]|nr:pyridoxal phosphate-dependent aminotransferase [Gammaproteobacteria bacterium]
MTDHPPHIAKRMSEIQPFHVMDLLACARQLEAEGRSIIHLEIGEPDFPTADPIIKAGQQALANKRTQYTPATGLPELRQAIADYYQQKFAVEIPVSRIVITPGASGALHLALGVLINPDDQVLMADPGYPCNRHFVRLLEGRAQSIPVDSSTGYQLNAELIKNNWTDRTIAALIASPSNPTGTLVARSAMQEILALLENTQGRLIVDEIYQGLVYGVDDYTALEFTEQAFVINSFSKYFGMTGWRLGWLVVPEEYMDAVDRLAQNIFLAAPTISQYAALAALTDETEIILRQRRDEFKKRRDYLLTALRALGFEIPVSPQGAFYIYANCSKFTDDSFKFVYQLLEQAGVAVTPGIDFGSYKAAQHVRFAYTRPIEVLAEGVKRIAEFVNNC